MKFTLRLSEWYVRMSKNGQQKVRLFQKRFNDRFFKHEIHNEKNLMVYISITKKDKKSGDLTQVFAYEDTWKITFLRPGKI